MSLERVLEGVDASRRVAWAQKYEADHRIAQLEDEVQRLQSLLSGCTCRQGRAEKDVADQILRNLQERGPSTRGLLVDQIGGSRRIAYKVFDDLHKSGQLVVTGKSANGSSVFMALGVDQ